MNETTILEMVKGIPNIVKLIDHWDAYYKGEPDCTVLIHSQYDMGHQDDLICLSHDDWEASFAMGTSVPIILLFMMGTMPYISIYILQAMLDLAPPEVDADIPGQDTDPNDLDDFEVDNNIGLIPQAANTLQNVDVDTVLIEHWPSDDLESLFYIFFKFVAKYGVPHGQLPPTWSQ
ncbi:hypothetical protein DFJ58DRAFT_842435 [Suillus subalutaceus]|uniref:uncharacterized protein n=1 Tax=Suillus subalutaceus TaxID=48586 RepID=UPI001B866F5F|nr:uncharacterized protein DFJ58DRAFT_842435 [Suillus subalutaceus]KAG1850359.1 hypothetical protein DFJ58DRAFT_842435 [Suillus subalutaceus]